MPQLSTRLIAITLLAAACGKSAPSADPPAKAEPAKTEAPKPPPPPVANPALDELAKLSTEVCACTDRKCITPAEKKVFELVHAKPMTALAAADQQRLAQISTTMQDCEKKLFAIPGHPKCEAGVAKIASCIDPASLAKASELSDAQLAVYLSGRGGTFQMADLVQMKVKLGDFKEPDCDDVTDDCLRDATIKK